MKLPKEFEEYLEKYGHFDLEGLEIFGKLENGDIENLPSYEAATKLYKQDYPLLDDEIVIYFDDYLNCIVTLNEKNEVFRVEFEDRVKIADSFQEWFKQCLEDFGVSDARV
ncbi:SMI1/KNR4 family protein [Helicobacter suis]|uniref:SMI1/KNR4 family protein n=1 Tax=Helicobacter suis TaxID=104628 RepID=UPI0013D35D8C|nr:SMI1/KNR4 family protein [Helicobacter suis]